MAKSSAIARTVIKKVVSAGQLSHFVDSVRVKFEGGRGGDGCISMLSLFANEFAGPDGGTGGNGGHVVLRANKQVRSLAKIASQYRGNPGEAGRGDNCTGKCGEHKFIDVPVGTLVAESEPKELAEHEIDPERSDLVADLDQDGSLFIAARGGAGGKGNNYYLSNANRHPRIAQAGAQGEVNEFELRIRIYAHVGLIGLPNAGKTSLLRTLTNANVKVGDWEFTTLHPQVGVLDFPDYTQVAISDLPGLIQDSHNNRGLGLRFLRHVGRCACLLYVVDLTRDPIEQLETLFHELDSHKQGLSRRPHMVLANKIDLPNTEENLAKLRGYLASKRPETKLVVGSSQRGDNLEELRLELRRMYDEHQARNADDLSETPNWS